MEKQKKFVTICLGFIFSVLIENHVIAANQYDGQDVGINENTITSQEFNYQIGPVPAYVNQTKAIPAKTRLNKNQGDLIFVLYDRQISLLESEQQEYVRFQNQALTSGALPNVSQVYMSFNPEYQKLVLHAIRIWRDGKAIDLTRKVKLDLMRRESNLERNMYEGNVTAVGVLPDTRVNDVIDLEYTIVGSNPIFGKKYADMFSLSQSSPMEHYHLSVITPENRPIKVMLPPNVSVQETKADGHISYSVTKENSKAMQFDDKTPDWYMSRQMIQLSEYQDWAEVEAWANRLFKVDAKLSPEIQKQIQLWKSAKLPQDKLAAEALQWVQTHIRYFGIELGVNSHLPSPPNQTVERKFGDCKDKSLLLASMLKALGVDAEPTLASISFRRNALNMLPSPAVFDHAIVTANIGGKSYYLDPTLTTQTGSLEKMGVTDFGGVLVLGKGSKELQLATYPDYFDNYYQRYNQYKITAFDKPVELTSKIKANFNMAEYMRIYHDSQSAEEFSKVYQDDIFRVYPNAQVVGEMEFADDKANNEVTLTLHFQIDDFFQYEPGRLVGTFYGTEILGWAALPNVAQRSTPYSIPGHSHITESIEFKYPEEVKINSDKATSTKSGEFWQMTTSTELLPGKFIKTWNLKANKEAVPPQKTGDYITETRNVRDQVIFTFRLPISNLTDFERAKLNIALQRLDKKYGNTNSDRVNYLTNSLVSQMLANHDILDGKLNSKFTAEAYKIRSQAYDNQGDVSHALEDIRQARKLNADNPEYMQSEADTLLGDGQFAEAAKLYAAIIEQGNLSANRIPDVYRAYGQSLYYQGQAQQAKQFLDNAWQLSQGQQGSMYTAIWLFLASGKDASATANLKTAMSNSSDHAWPYSVAQMFVGEITPEQLLKQATSDDKGKTEDQICEASFYLGKKFQLDKNTEKAKEYFQKSIDQGVTPYVENNFSFYELGRKRMPKNILF